MVMSTGTGTGSSSPATSYTTVLSAITFSAVSNSGRASRVTSNSTISGPPLVRGQLSPFTTLRVAWGLTAWCAAHGQYSTPWRSPIASESSELPPRYRRRASARAVPLSASWGELGVRGRRCAAVPPRKPVQRGCVLVRTEWNRVGNVFHARHRSTEVERCELRFSSVGHCLGHS
jgi:hypothetical protein